MDEPASALDPIATLKIEELMHQLAQNYTMGPPASCSPTRRTNAPRIISLAGLARQDGHS